MAIRDEDRATVGRGLIARIVAVAGGVFALMILFVLGGKIVENVDASEIVLIQSLGGSLNWHTQPGWIWQGFGKVTRYQKRGLIRFQPPARESASDERLPIVFNDAGKGVVKGSINYELPTNAKQLTEMHSFYPDPESLEAGLVRPVGSGVSDAEWAAYLYLRSNTRGRHRERWRHTHGCGRYFIAERDTEDDVIVSTSRIDAGIARPGTTADTAT